MGDIPTHTLTSEAHADQLVHLHRREPANIVVLSTVCSQLQVAAKTGGYSV